METPAKGTITAKKIGVAKLIAIMVPRTVKNVRRNCTSDMGTL
ncbi:hypothetical protein HerbRD11066_78520 [Herbidospora sp. RD11066]